MNDFIVPWEGELKAATLRTRPHRYRINVRLENDRYAGVHCVNPGRGEGLMRKGARVWISRATNRRRALKWTWEFARKGKALVGTNSVTANKPIDEALRRKYISGLKSARKIARERCCGRQTRIDFEVTLWDHRKHYIEVKNCHLRYPDGNAYFPDSKTLRSRRHLWHLRRLVREGHEASLFIAIQRADVLALRPSDFHDPKFAAALRRAAGCGVRVRAFSFEPTTQGFVFRKELPVDLAPYPLRTVRRWSAGQRRFSGWNHWNSPKDIRRPKLSRSPKPA